MESSPHPSHFSTSLLLSFQWFNQECLHPQSHLPGPGFWCLQIIVFNWTGWVLKNYSSGLLSQVVSWQLLPFESVFLRRFGLSVCPSIPLGRSYSLTQWSLEFGFCLYLGPSTSGCSVPFVLWVCSRGSWTVQVELQGERGLFVSCCGLQGTCSSLCILRSRVTPWRHHWPGLGFTSLALERQCQLLCPFQPFRHRGHILKIETFVDSVYCTRDLI